MAQQDTVTRLISQLGLGSDDLTATVVEDVYNAHEKDEAAALASLKTMITQTEVLSAEEQQDALLRFYKEEYEAKKKANSAKQSTQPAPQRKNEEKPAKRNNKKKTKNQSRVVQQKLYKEEIEAKTKELTEAKNDLEKAKAELQAKATAKVLIYTRSAATGGNQDAISEVKRIITSSGVVSLDEMRDMDVSHDDELACYLKELCGGKDVPYPLVCLAKRDISIPIGNLDTLKQLEKDGKLAGVLSGEVQPSTYLGQKEDKLKDGTGIYVGQGVLDHCLDAAEYLMSASSSLMWLPVTAVKYAFGYTNEEVPKGENDIDFDVVHTNWYWRNLKRKFRFFEKDFIRMHPDHNDVRARHTYTSVESIKQEDDKNIVIIYNDGSSPDYLCAVPEDIRGIVQVIVARASNDGHTVSMLSASTSE